MATSANKTRVEHHQMAVIDQPSNYRSLDQIQIILDGQLPRPKGRSLESKGREPG